MKLLLTCFKWTAPVLAQELKIMGYKSYDNFPTWLYVDGTMEDVYKINLNSRIANKVYMEVESEVIIDFNQLFDFISDIDWKQYIKTGHKIAVSSTIYKSDINSERSTQSIVNKAIIKKLVGDKSQRMSDPKKEEINVFVQILENNCSVFVNTTWEWLHNRLYRWESWEAPIKENIAASLVRICNWHFKHPLLDPMCGSGTICIEAAMIAKNIAPGLKRKFAFESFEEFDSKKFESMLDELEAKIFKWDYKIVWSDIDANMIKIAKANAIDAGVDDVVEFKQQKLSEIKEWEWYIITNPPYGKRMWGEDLDKLELLYKDLIDIYDNGAKWCFITSWEDTWSLVSGDFKIKQLNNNGEEAQIYLKK